MIYSNIVGTSSEEYRVGNPDSPVAVLGHTFYDEDLTVRSTSSTTPESAMEFTAGPLLAGTYRIDAMCAVSGSDDGVGVCVELYVDGVLKEKSVSVFNPAAENARGIITMMLYYSSGSGSNIDVSLKFYRTTDFGSAVMFCSRIAVERRF